MAEEKLGTGPEGQLGLGDVVKDEPGGAGIHQRAFERRQAPADG